MPITKQELARRLRSAREAGGLTQEQVGERLGLSRPSVVQLESGNRAVSSLELDRLARLYGRDVAEFLAAEFDAEESLVAVFRAEAAAADGENLSDAVSVCVALAREFANLEDLLGVDSLRVGAPAYPMPALCSKWQAVEQGSRVAVTERSRLNLGALPLGNVADLLESQGVRTALLTLPADVSGLTLMEPSLSFFVVANRDHGILWRRFSWIHEYAHILFDRDRRGTVSRSSERDALAEVRANAFAAAFLMPADGMRDALTGLGKGQASRERWAIFDEEDTVPAEGRAEPGSQTVQLYDAVLLADHFRVSRIAMLYRLHNLQLLSQPALEALLDEEEAGRGQQLEQSLGLRPREAKNAGSLGRRRTSQSRFLGLALEAYRRAKISRGKLKELAGLAECSEAELDQLLLAAGLEPYEGDDEVLLPKDLE